MEETLKYILYKVNQTTYLIFILILKVRKKCRNIELSDYRAVELSSCRTIELSDYRAAYPYDSILHQAVVEHILTTVIWRISSVFYKFFIRRRRSRKRGGGGLLFDIVIENQYWGRHFFVFNKRLRLYLMPLFRARLLYHHDLIHVLFLIQLVLRLPWKPCQKHNQPIIDGSLIFGLKF